MAAPEEPQPAQPELLRSVLNAFPPVNFAIAYGSGVFLQPGLYQAEAGHAAEPAVGSSFAAAPAAAAAAAAAAGPRPMLDFIFGVEDPLAWHAENLRRHRSHYSALGMLGPSSINAVAERLGAGVYFNTLVPWGGPHQLIKYGVTRLAALQEDLLHWSTLYVAGRLHKPVALLQEHPGVAAAQRANLASALRVALLLLPPRFTTHELLLAICGLSYSGDIRMGLAEDSKKVQRIVEGSEAALRQLYAAPLAAAQTGWGVLQQGGGDGWARDESPPAQAALARALPRGVLAHVSRQLGQPAGADGASAAGAAAALAAQTPPRQQQLVRQAVAAVVRASSRRQAAAGLLSAGVLKSVRYGLAKLRKAWRV